MRENLYSKYQKGNSKTFKNNFDQINWTSSSVEEKVTGNTKRGPKVPKSEPKGGKK